MSRPGPVFSSVPLPEIGPLSPRFVAALSIWKAPPPEASAKARLLAADPPVYSKGSAAGQRHGPAAATQRTAGIDIVDRRDAHGSAGRRERARVVAARIGKDQETAAAYADAAAAGDLAGERQAAAADVDLRVGAGRGDGSRVGIAAGEVFQAAAERQGHVGDGDSPLNLERSPAIDRHAQRVARAEGRRVFDPKRTCGDRHQQGELAAARSGQDERPAAAGGQGVIALQGTAQGQRAAATLIALLFPRVIAPARQLLPCRFSSTRAIGPRAVERDRHVAYGGVP